MSKQNTHCQINGHTFSKIIYVHTMWIRQCFFCPMVYIIAKC